MRLLFDESLSPRLVTLLSDLFPQSESALRNGLAGCGDRKILQYAAFPDAKVIILRSCDYPTGTAADLLRRHAIRIAELAASRNQLLILHQ